MKVIVKEQHLLRMDIITKLERIKVQGSFTQQKLAYKLDVSFQTINAWLKRKSRPRKSHQILIDQLYFELFGLENIDLIELKLIKEKVLSHKDESWRAHITKSEETLKKLLVKITYHSNSIEGSTLTEADTDAILFKNKVLENHTLIEQLEVINHQKAFNYALQLANNIPLTRAAILELHKKMMAGILENAGVFRNHPVRILGSFVPTSNHLSIEKRIVEFLLLFNESIDDPTAHLAKTHAIFEQIHPFSDGNGRIGRLLMLVLALKHGLPPVLVLQERKKAYYKYLQDAQLRGNYLFLEFFICESILEITKYLEG